MKQQWTASDDQNEPQACEGRGTSSARTLLRQSLAGARRRCHSVASTLLLGVVALAMLPGIARAADVLVSSLTDTPDPATRGGNITFTITAENSAADTANNVVVTYPLPANTQFVSVSDAAVPGACTHDGATPGIVTCNYPTLLGTQAAPAGPVRTISVVLRTTGATVTTLASTVTITSADADANPSNNTLSQNTTINDGADLSATLAGSPNPATGGGVVTWTVNGSNAGPNTSGPVTFVTTLPGVLTYVSGTGSGWSCSNAGQTVTCTRAALAVGAYPTLTLSTRITGVASGTVTLNGSIASTVADPDSSNNATVASVTVNAGTDLAVTQSAITPNPVSAGFNATFVLQPVNNGPNVATAGANVSFPLPAGFTLVSATGSTGWSCTSAGSPVTVTCTYAASWATANAGTLTIVATAPTVASPTAFNNITATIAPNPGGPADPNPANDTAARNLTVSPDGVDLSVTKNKTPSIVAQNANMTSTLVVANAGPRNAASGTITLTDALDPTKEAFVSASGSNWACVSAAPNVNCTYNAVLNSGTNASTLTIVTQALAAGTATNNATTSYSGTPGDYNAANDTIGASVTVSSVPNSPDLKVTLGASTAGGTQTTVEFNESAITYAVVLTNQNSTTADAQNVVVSLTIPGRTTSTPVTLVSTVLTNTSGASNATFVCTGTGTGSGNVNCTQTAGTLLKPGDVVTFNISATRPMSDGNFTATATATSTSQGDPVPADNSATLAVQIDPIADVELVSKVLAANPVRAGTNAVYTITARNNGPSSAAAGLQVTDVFTIPGGDAGFTFISAAPSSGGTCSGLTANTSYTSGTPTLTCTWAAATTSGSTRTVTVTVRPNWQAGTAARTLDNVATVVSSTPQDTSNGPGTAADSKSLTLNINPAQVDLLINNTDTPDPLGYDPGTPTNNDVTYNVATTNNGPSVATGTGFTFTMTPPAGKTMTFRGDGAASTVAASNPSGSIAGSLCDNVGSAVTGSSTLTVTCTFASGGLMTSGATTTRYLVFRVGSAPNAGGDTYATNAVVFRNETDSNTGNDNELETTTVRVRSDLSVTKTPSINPVSIRQPFNWTIVVSNAGPGDSQTTGLSDTLPTGMVYTGTPTFAVSGGGATGNCAVAGQVMTCAFGTLPANQTATVTVPARMPTYPSGGTIQNCATASTSEIDPNSVNNLNVCSTLTVVRSSLAGTVFQDRDRTGANAGTPQSTTIDPRIAGVAIALSGTDAYGNTVALSATTDVNGAYAFTDLSPADATGYTITETQPVAYVNGPAAPPNFTEAGTYAAGGTGNSAFTAIPLAANRAGAGYDFPEVRKPDLTGFVYIDVNLNGVRNAGTDTAINGATVRLLNANTLAVVATTTTNSSGVYTFSAIDPLIPYTIEEPLPTTPANLSNGPVNAGLIGGAACTSGCTPQANTPSAGIDRIAAIDLGAGVDGTAFNFGEIAIAAISGSVYVDRNRDGTMDATPTDARLPGVTLTLYAGTACSGGAIASTTTDALGAWSFTAAQVGSTYTVCETQPAGYGEGSINPGTNGASNAANAVTITTLPSGGSAGNNFGERVGGLAGSVYVDYNAATPASYDNGVRDTGEPGISGITVTLTGTDVTGSTVNRTATTDASGNYAFIDLLQPNAGGYTLTEGVVSGSYLDGRDTAGTAGGSTAVNDVIGGIALGAGVQGTGYLFGELPNATIAGTVYIDRNRSDTLDATPIDGRIAGVTIRLLRGADCATGSVLQTTTTSASGGYVFNNLAAGAQYLVCETQPAGYANGVQNPGSGATTPSANTISIASLGSSGSSSNDFGERVGSLAGSVYLDYTAGSAALSNNGVRDGAEAGLAGVSVTLTGTDAAGNAVNTSATTDVNGNYLFADLLQANGTGYTLTEGSVTGAYIDGRDTAGTAGGNVAVNDVISGITLGAGVQSTGYLFGELPNATIAGTVYVDRNRNNTIDATPTDGRIAGVTVRLVQGADCASGTQLQSIVSNASGVYSFTNLGAGSAYLVCETQPAGYANGVENPGTGATTPGANVIAIASLANTGSSGNDFGERVGAIAGSVYVDYTAGNAALSNNGVRDGGETGITGVTVTLTGTDIAGAAVSRTATTDGTGNYRFDDLLQASAGGYTLTEGSVTGAYLDGRDTAGSVGGSVAVNDVISGIALGAGVQATDYLFGELPNSTIAGTVYVDRNRNGTIDATPTDARLAGVTVRLVQGADCASGTQLQTTLTNASGAYGFSGVAAGSAYLVCEAQPAGYANGVENPGTGATSTVASTIAIASLPTAGSTGNNFGERIGAIAGSVYLDVTSGNATLTNNGVRDVGEAGLTGVTISLTGSDITGAAVSRTAATDANGNYRFDDVLQANGAGYTLSEGPVSGVYLDGKDTAGSAGGNATVNDVISGIALGAGVQATDYLFGELPNSAIAGTVYVDRNRSNTLDATPTDARMANVTIRLVQGANCASGTLLQTTTTNASGAYTFSGLISGGAYLVCEMQPAGYANGTENPGTAATSTAANAISIASLPNSGSSGNDFGERIGSIGGSVYIDFTSGSATLTNNGVRDTGETGIAGVTVTLTGTDITGGAVSRSATTDGIGNYRFDDVLQASAGGYTLAEGTVAGAYLDGKDTAGSAGGNAAVNDVVSGIVLGAGVQATDYLFGELPNSTISGTVYVDRNRNNTIDATPTDGRLANVTIRLVQGADCATGTLLQTTTTSATGTYGFTGLAAGSAFLICETQPAGHANGVENPGTGATSPAPNSIAIPALANGGSTGNDFGERLGAIAGSVYVDFSPATPAQTNNGLRDSGETGLAGVTVTLTGNDITGTAVNRTATTDVNGNYRFDDLLQSGATGYALAEGTIPPAAGSFNDGRDTAGSAGGSNAVNDRLSGIVLAVGALATDYVFGELPIAPITGTVYVDRNRDGVMDASPADGRLPGVSIALYAGSACTGTPVATALTDASGNYALSGASAGLNYAICETQPAGYADGSTHPGPAGASNAPNVTLITALPATGSAGNNFGERIGSLAGSVFIDFNAATPSSFNNGIRDAGEAGIAGVTVTLSGRDAAGTTVNRTATTDGNGNYRFDDVVGADATGYTLTEGAVPAGLQDGRDTAGSAGGSVAVNDAISAIALGAGAQASGYTFGELQNASIAGTVYVDRNRNNAIDATPTDARLAGVTIRLVQGADCASGNTLQTTTTSATGAYAFSGLTAGGAYLVCETQPAGYANGAENPGTGATSTTANTIAIAALPVAGTSGNDFGERIGSIAGAVYVDFDPAAPNGFNNGIREAGEPGIAGVTVTLTGRDVTGAAINRSATTDGNGNYRFDDLLAADPAGYTVTEGAVPTLQDGRDTAGSAGGNTAVNDAISAIALGAGVQATGYNFAELQNAAIAGTVYIDRNRNGTIDATPTDARLAGVTVRVMQGADCSAGTTLQTTTTSATGTYAFSGLPAGGAYLICETQPAGYANGGENPGAGGTSTAPNVITIASLPGAGTSGNDFGERIGAIAGAVYIDFDAAAPAGFNNGLREAGEPGVAGIVVTLTGRDVTGAVVNKTATTDANGNYRFDDLLAADAAGYMLTEGAVPSYLGDGRDTAGSAGGSTAVNDSIGAIALGVGVQATGYNFGELPNASLGGTVYSDRNRNNTLDATPTDGRIAGVTIRLVQGADCATGTLVKSTVTSAAGAYGFSGLSAGAGYLVCEVQPAGYLNGTENPGNGGTSTVANTIVIASLPASGSAANDFAERTGSLAGSVYVDYSAANPALTNNGIRDPGEPGVAGVQITLSGRDVTGAAVNLSTTTDGNGNYRFDDLLQSDSAGYTVAEGTLPAAAGALVDGRDSAGSAGGNSAVNDRLQAIVLGAGVQATDYVFGELPNASIGGTVFIDRNRNGAIDPMPADGRIAGVSVRLLLGNDCASGTLLQSTSTDASGAYAFDGLAAGGTYVVCETQPVGYGNGVELPAAGGTRIGVNAIGIANLGASGSRGNDFGERLGSIAGSVFLDANNDGVRASGDAGIAGVTVTLTGTDALGNAASKTAMTDGNGNYRFDDLLASTGYTLTQQPVQPVVGGVTTLNGRTVAGSSGGTASAVTLAPSAITAIALAGGVDSINNLFAEILPVSISGTVFSDMDNNGQRNLPTDAGIANVAVTLTGTDDTGATIRRDVRTGADGGYAFADLRPGAYTLTEPTQPEGTSNGQTIAGSAGGTATPVATLPSAISAIPLTTPGTSAIDYLFAEVPSNAVIRGRVWLDANNDGRVDAGEAGIAQVTIELTGTAGGATVTRTTTTDATGAFAFENLAPGSYALREPQQPAGTLNGLTIAGSSGGTVTTPATAVSAITAIPLAAGQTSSANLFAELPPADIAGRVFGDDNDNGLVDGSETGIAGVTLTLTGTDDLGAVTTRSVVSANDGSYLFANLRPGAYAVTEPTQPAGTLNGITTAGTLGGTATAKSVVPSAISVIALPAGGHSTANNFGELANSPDLQVGKTHVEPRFTVNNPGTYRIAVRNAGQAPTTGEYTVTDRLPTGLTLSTVPTGTGWTCTGAAGAASFACTSSAVLAPGAAAPVITAVVRVDAAAAKASPVVNAVLVEGGGELELRRPTAAERDAFNADASKLAACGTTASANGCGDSTVVQLAAAVSGTVWYDMGNSSSLLDSGDRRLKDWQVEVSNGATGEIVGRATTGSDGAYRIVDLVPGVPLAVRFREPQSSVVFGYPVNGEAAPGSSGVGCNESVASSNGSASSCVTVAAMPQLTIVLAAGQELTQQSLPVDPSGIVYDSGSREPVPGSVVTLQPSGACAGWNPATQVVGAGLGGYRVDGTAIAMTVGSDGLYQFLFGSSAPASCNFALTVTPPAGYTFRSTLIPANAGSLSAPGGPTATYKVQPQTGAPTAAVGPGTVYWLSIDTGSAGASVIHNHIPVDAAAPTGLTLAKTGDKTEAEVGDTVRYAITVRLTSGALPRQVTVIDRLPAGFTYVKGTAMVDGVTLADPTGLPGPTLAFNLGRMPAAAQMLLQYRVRVDVGSQQGDGINRARAYGCMLPAGCVAADRSTPLTGSVATNEGQFKVRVTGGVFTTEACVAGKIFVDCNGNHVQDAEEIGIPGVRLLLQDGTTLISDAEGKYSACGLLPKSHVLKVDPSTLPKGSQLTTSSNRNLGDAGSLWIDLKNGELHRADFIEGSCAAPVMDQVKARRGQGEVRAPDSAQPKNPALRFDSRPPPRPPSSDPLKASDRDALKAEGGDHGTR